MSTTERELLKVLAEIAIDAAWGTKHHDKIALIQKYLSTMKQVDTNEAEIDAFNRKAGLPPGTRISRGI